MDAARIRDEQQLQSILDEMHSYSATAQISRLSQMRQGLELDELYYEQKGKQAGLARTGRCLALIEERFAALQTKG